MIKTFINAWKLPEVRKRILYTLLLIVIFRIGSIIPVPGVDSVQLANFMEQNSNSLVSTLNIISGGALSKLSIFALGSSVHFASAEIFVFLASFISLFV